VTDGESGDDKGDELSCLYRRFLRPVKQMNYHSIQIMDLENY